MRALGVITHVGEMTFSLSMKSMLRQGCSEVLVISNVEPMYRAFNQGLDSACKLGYDYMLLLAADVILKPFAFKEMLKAMTDNSFILSGCSDDLIFGSAGPSGFLLYNMKLIGMKYRYLSGPLEDWLFAKRIAAETGWKHTKVKSRPLSVHHPIWTPEDIFMKMRFCLPKFKDNKKMLGKYRKFLDEGLKNHPENMVFIIGNDLYNIMEEKGFDNLVLQDKGVKALKRQWTKFKRNYELTGKEFYAMPQYVSFAERKLARGKNL